jgi:DNA-binding response OmpR family regulator
MVASQNDCLLRGRLILVVQRQWLIAQQLSDAFEAEGARVLLAHNATSGALSADAPDLAAVVLDSESAQLLFRKLKERGVPFVIYTGHEHVDDDCAAAPVVRKPANAGKVVGAVRQLLQPQHW